jgi:hypothetical protein
VLEALEELTEVELEELTEDDTELTDEDELEELELSVAMAVASMLMESAPAATVAANFFIEKGAGNNGT